MPTPDNPVPAENPRVCRVSPEERSGVAQMLGLLEDPGLADDVWLMAAWRGNRLAGGLWVRPQPGATALVEPPLVLPPDDVAIATALLCGAVQELSRAGMRLAQALIETPAAQYPESWQAAGFAHSADLAYLSAGESAFPVVLPDDGLQFEAFQESQSPRLASLIEQTYQGSLDCPALDGVRNLDDVLSGYRATGLYDPANWFFARQGGQDIGCLLLTTHPAGLEIADSPLELVYMGVVPAARGQGFGRGLVRYAQWHARRLGRRRLLLAVDASNQPAVRTYAECGFTAWAMRQVWLKFF
ncbi:MAG: GNAT family N-acetyltransferase [Pirellulales bacterium]